MLERLLGPEPGPSFRLDLENVQAWLDEDRKAVQALLTAPLPLRDKVDDVLRRTHARSLSRQRPSTRLHSIMIPHPAL